MRLPRCASLWPASCAGVRERRYGQARCDLGSSGFPPPVCREHSALAWVREPLARILRWGAGTKVRSSPARHWKRRVSSPVCGSIVRLPGCASLWPASCAGVRERRYGQARRDLGSGGFPPPFVESMEVLAEQREVDTPMKSSRPLHTWAGDPCAWLFA